MAHRVSEEGELMIVAATCWIACLAIFLEFAERAPTVERRP